MLNVILAMLAAAAVQIPQETKSVDQCLDLLRDTGRAVNVVDVNDCVERVVQSADKELHQELIDLASSWVRDLDTSVRTPEDLTSDPQAASKLYHLNAVVAHGLQPLSNDQELAAEVLELITRIITKTWCSIQVQYQCMKLLGQIDFPAELRRDAVLEIIEHRRKSGALPGVLLDMIDPSYFPRLVELVNFSDDPDTFHFGAASALAHCGNRSILPRLKTLRPTFRAKHPNIEDILVYFAWQIEVQHPPEKILEVIRTTQEPSIEKRLWAVRRAVDLSLGEEQIRNAILAYASQVQPNKHGIRPGLSSIKSVGLAVGVLQANDLRDVQVKTKPTH